MRGPKITVIGAGSYFFGKPVIRHMATSEVMKGGTLALVDTNPKALEVMMTLARRVFDELDAKVKLVGSTDRKEVIKDSDFVVLTFSDRNAHFRKIDTEISGKHGIRMCSSDTIGPGGIFRAMREIPHVMSICKDIERLAPEAWVINFINPTAVIGIALRRFAPNLRSFALCDGNHEPYATQRRCAAVGIIPADTEELSPDNYRKLELNVAGVNHFTWITRFNYDGQNMFPKLRESVLEKVAEEKENNPTKAKPRFNWHYALQLMDIFGAFPCAISHTKEYVPYFQGYGITDNFPEPVKLFEADVRAEEMNKAWKDTEKYANGNLSVSEFIEKIRNDHATDIIESMWGNLRKPFFINTFNNGAVSNMPADAFLELRCDIDMKGPRPQPAGEMPRGLLGLQHQVLDTHEMTAQAAVTGDKTLLRRAMLTDPICNNIGDVDKCIKDLLEAEKDALPEYWQKKSL